MILKITKKLMVLSLITAGLINLTLNAQTQYGVTQRGGIYGYGVLYKYTVVSNTYDTLVNFDYNSSTAGYLYGNLVQAPDGKLYGAAYYGGTYGYGSIYSYDPSNDIFTVEHEFDYTNGGYGVGGLCLASNNKLYGVTYQGGINGAGVIYEFDYTTNTYASKYDLDPTNEGANCISNFMQASNGKLYAMIYSGGINGVGTLISYEPSTNTVTKLHDFDYSVTGGYPLGYLTEAANGKLYGLLTNGGTNGSGTLIEYDIALDTLMVKVNFDYSINGSGLEGSLSIGPDGMLYGTASSGGANYGNGTLFKYDYINDTLILLYEFDNYNGGSNDGAYSPRGGLTLSSDGKFYGNTTNGGINNAGTLFSFDPLTNTFNKNIDLDNNSGGYPYWTQPLEYKSCKPNGGSYSTPLAPGIYQGAFSDTSGSWVHYCDCNFNLLLSLDTTGTGAKIKADSVSVKITTPMAEFHAKGTGFAADNATFILGRNWDVKPTIQPSSPVTVRQYFKLKDYKALNDSLLGRSFTPLASMQEMYGYKVTKKALGTFPPFNSITTSDVNLLAYNSTPSVAAFRIDSASNNADYWFTSKVAGFTGGGGGGGSAGAVPFIPLPLELINFTAKGAATQVNLDWTTATELNSHYFLVERSLNGIDFSVVGRVEASGNSNSVKNYSFADTKLISGVTRYFYRLKMVDFDYTLSHSEIRFVDINSINPVLAGVYPNPFKDQVSITLNSEEVTTITVTINDINGREIIRQSLNVEEGLRIHSISTSNLNAGIYMMSIDNGVSVQHTRIVKN